MVRTKLPPQAYTRETLAEAFEWLKTQPQHIQDSAHNPDLLVSLYLHACRHGKTPSSINFKKDLKNLAQNLEEFENDDLTYNAQQVVAPNYKNTPSAITQPTAAEVNTQLQPQIELPSHIAVTPAVHQALSQEAPLQPPVMTSPKPFDLAQLHSSTSLGHKMPPQNPPMIKEKISLERSIPQNISIFEQLDQKSQEVIAEVQSELNLSSPDEAMRMLLVLGIESFKNKFKS